MCIFDDSTWSVWRLSVGFHLFFNIPLYHWFFSWNRHEQHAHARLFYQTTNFAGKYTTELYVYTVIPDNIISAATTAATGPHLVFRQAVAAGRKVTVRTQILLKHQNDFRF